MYIYVPYNDSIQPDFSCDTFKKKAPIWTLGGDKGSRTPDLVTASHAL